MSTTATKSILIEHNDGGATIVENVPSSAKITYGPISPAKGGYGHDNVLRIYTTQNNQLAVFRNVASFRDLTLAVKVREVTVTEESEHRKGPDIDTGYVEHTRTGRFVVPKLEF